MPLDRAAALTRFGGARVASLATTRRSGGPHLVPVTFALDGETVLTMIDSKPKTTTALKRLANIAATPSVSLLAHHYDENWKQLWWVRIDGEATVSDDPPILSQSRRLLQEKYPQYQDRPPDGPAIVIQISNVTWWEWTETPPS